MSRFDDQLEEELKKLEEEKKKKKNRFQETDLVSAMKNPHLVPRVSAVSTYRDLMATDEDDIAPSLLSNLQNTYKSQRETTDEAPWYQRGAFSDGYQVGDITKSILGIEDDKKEKSVYEFTAPETTVSLDELKQKKDYLAGRTWRSADEEKELLQVTQQYNQAMLSHYSDLFSKTQMDGQEHTILEEIGILANMTDGKEKEKRKEAVLKKMEELGMDRTFYAHFAGDGSFDWGTFGNWLGSATMAGLNSFNKGLLDTADILLGNPLKAIGWEDNPISEGAEYYGSLYEKYNYDAQLYSEKLGGGAWNFGSSAVEGTVGAIPNAILALMTAGASVGATPTTTTLVNQAAYQAGDWLTKAGLTVETMMKNPQFWTSFARTLGSDYKEAKEMGASDTAAAVGSVLTSLLNAGIEIGPDGLSGIQGLPQEVMGGGKPLLEWVESSIEEGGEEMLQKFVSEIIAKVGYGSDKEILNPIEYAQEGAMGVISGMALGGGQVGLQTAGTAIQEHQANKLTDMEQTVKDKIVEKRIAEKENGGKPLTKQEKAAIEEDVDRNLRKGFISADEIEEVLGGDAYTAFKTERDKFFASEDYQAYKKAEKDEAKQIRKLEKRLKQLDKAPNTVGNSRRYDAIQKRLDALKTNSQAAQLKAKLETEASRVMGIRNQMRSQVMGQVKDSRLAESYRELARSKQKFETDISKYKDENARKTVESILASGLGDNTTQFHETVEFLAKLSADKGVVFDLTKTDRMDAKHKKEGYITNGYVSDDGKITLNMDSKRALNTTVGHEITHVMEKAGVYKDLQSAVFSYAVSKEGKAKFDARLEAAKQAYEGKKNTSAEAEVTADLIGEYLFNDYSFVQSLSKQNRNVFQRIYDEIKYMVKIATAGSKEARELEKVKKLFDQAYRENVKGKKDTSTEDTKKSYSSIANSFFGNEDMSTSEFFQEDYHNTEGYQQYVEQCVNNLRQSQGASFDEDLARASVQNSIDGIVRVAVASKQAGYDISDIRQVGDKSVALEGIKDGKNRKLFSSLEPNSDYFTSHDISTICDKRKNFAAIYDEIVRLEEAKGVPADKRFFNNVSNYFAIHDIMAKKGLTTPCRQCYVESMRKNLAPMAKAFLELVAETNVDNTANPQLYHQSGANKGELKSNNAELREAILKTLEEHPEYNLSVADLTVEMLSTEDGLAQLRIQAPLIYEAFNSFYGQAKPKMPKSPTPFRFGELTAMLTDNKGKIKPKLIEKINSTGGFRFQSYSDFQIQNYVDVLQALFEAGTLGLNGHAYTKVPAFLDATEGTNLKRNISIFMYKDGNEWKLDRNDSFPYSLDEIYNIVKADKDGNTSIIAVSQNDEMSAWIMANDLVGYGIPFHKSGLAMATVRNTIVKEGGREIRGYKGIKDHTKQQTEVWKDTAYNEDGTVDHKANTKVKKGINIYDPAVGWDFENKGNLSKIDLIKKNLMAYIDACEDAGYRPKFRDYVWKNDKVLQDVLKFSKELGYVSQDATIDDISFQYGEYRIPYGYYKFLGDFGMFTPDGKAAPQKPLSLENYDFDKAVEFFSNAENLKRTEILQQFANGQVREDMRASDLTTEELSEIISQRRAEVAEEATKYSMTPMDEEYMAAVNRGDMETAQRMVNERAEAIQADIFAKTDVPTYRVRRGATPKKTIKVYKVFTISNTGKPSALFVNSQEDIPVGVWLDAQDTFHFTDQKNGHLYVPSTKNPNTKGGATGRQTYLSDISAEDIAELEKRGYLKRNSKGELPKSITSLAYRPGWHAGDLPFFPQGGMQIEGSNYPNVHRYNQVVFECEMIADNDYTDFDINDEGKVRLHDMQEMPQDGSYKFATNPMAQSTDIGAWYIGSSIKINRALTQEECDRILQENGRDVQEWQAFQDPDELALIRADARSKFTDKKAKAQAAKDAEYEYEHRYGNMDLSALGYDPTQTDSGKKLPDAVTYDDDGNVIPLSERFNPNKQDVRYSMTKAEKAKMDEDYLAAVNSGDEEVMNHLVREYAKASMPDSKLVDENGNLRVVYHGTNTGDFTVFNPDYIGMSSGDDGFFGMGFYFAYSKGEASYYGAQRIIPAYLNLTNPFNFQRELNTYNGKRARYGHAPDAVALMNFADKFPDIAMHITMGAIKNGESSGKQISVFEFAKAFKDIIENKEFDYQEITNEYGETETLVTADPQVHEYEYNGETHSWRDFGFQKRFMYDHDILDVAYEYLSNAVYSYIDIPRFTSVILDNNREFTAELKARGYDGTIQSDHGDEAVAFYPNQIKSAAPITRDDDGNVIPLSKRFDNEQDDIRYSMTKVEEIENAYQYNLDNEDMLGAEMAVEEMANLAMPDSKIRGKDGRLIPVYHGTNADFWEFDTSADGGKNGTAEGFGIYLSDDTEVTEIYGDRQIKMFANITKPATSFKKTITRGTLTKLIKDTCIKQAQRMVEEDGYDSLQDALRDTWISNYVMTYDMSMEQAYREVANSFLQENDNDKDLVHEVMFGMAIRSYDQAMDFYRNSLTPVTGIDGFVTKWTNSSTGKSSNIYLAFDSSQLKSADAVTYDEGGNVIPLTERFNPEKKDIRFSLSPEDEAPGSGYVPSRDIGVHDPLADIAPVGEVPNADPNTESVLDNADGDNIAPTVSNVENVEAPTPGRYEEWSRRQAELTELLKDKNTYLSNRAAELYKEIRNLKKGVRASKALGYLLDTGHEWSAIRAALVNIKHTPGERVNMNSAIESIARQMLNEEYEDLQYELDELNAHPVNENTAPQPITTVQERVNQKIANTQAELDKLIQYREDAYQHYAEQIAKAEAELAGKKNQHTATAESLRRSIERLKRLQGNEDANYEKRIHDLEKRIEKYRSEDYSRAEYRRDVQTKMTKFWADTIGDTSTWLDLPLGLAYKTKTLRRILRAVVRDANGKPDIELADTIYDELETKYDSHEAQLKVESGKLKQVFADLKLTEAEDTYAQMLGEFRHNPETTLTQELLDEYYQKHKKKIDTAKVDHAIEEARKLYDDLIVRVNKVLKAQGMREIPYRQGYFPHFTNPKQNWLMKALNWKPIDTEIPTSIAGLTQDFKPQRSWQTFAQKRRGDTTDYSLYKGLDTYVHGALDWIYHIEDLQSRRSLENYIRFIHSDEGIQQRIKNIQADDSLDADEVQDQINAVLDEAKNPLSGLVRELMNRTNTLAAKKSSMDREMEDMVNRKVYSTMTNLNNRVTANMVVGSFSSALTNFIPMVQSWHQVSPVYTVRGLGDMIRSTIHDDGTIAKSDFLTNRLIQEENLYKTGWDKVSDKAAFMMNVVDNITSQTVWRSKYLQNLKEGMSESMAIKDADQFAKNLMAGRSRGNAPSIFDAKNPLTKIFTAFQLEVANQYGYMFEDVPQDTPDKARLVKGYATAFLGAYLYNALYSSLVGRDAALDPIGIIEDLLKGLFDDEEEPEEDLMNFGADLLEEVPFIGGLLGGGRIPIQSALPYGTDSTPFESMLNDVSNGDWQSMGKELLKPLYYLVMPVGGGQIKKTVEGLGMFSDDHPVAGSYTDSGKLRFPVEDNIPNRIQAALFGQYASKNARDYFDNNRSALGESQIQEYMDVDLPIADYWNYRDGLKGLKTHAEKADFINSLDIETWQKNLLLNNILDRKEEVDMESYGDFSGWDDFDYAQKNPDAYTLSKAVTSDFSEYRRYLDEMGDINSKDENGVSVNGLKKQRVAEYINGLDIDYGAKLILFKSQYKADDTYNKEIIEYINSREDISFDEAVSILRSLGFTVTDEGRVTWD